MSLQDNCGPPHVGRPSQNKSHTYKIYLQLRFPIKCHIQYKIIGAPFYKFFDGPHMLSGETKMADVSCVAGS